jgi:predicted Zn-dependent protease
VLRGLLKNTNANAQTILSVVNAYQQLGNTSAVQKELEGVLSNTNANAQAVLSVATAFLQMGNIPAVERAFARATTLLPDNPDTWYDYARVQATLGKMPDALASLKQAVALSNARLKTNPSAFNISKDAITNQSFASIRANQDFLKTVAQ